MEPLVKKSLMAVTLFMVLPGVSLATLFSWHDRVRPPVSLREALDIAEKLLGEDAANRYCVEVSIYGNPMAAPKPGAWNLFFAAADGSRKHVYVDMDRNAKLSTWNEAIDWKKDAGHRLDLNDAFVRLKSLFEKEKLDVQLEKNDNRLTAQFNTRNYRFHSQNLDGSYETELTEEIGPAHDGFIINASILDEQIDFNRSVPYWREQTQTFPTAIAGKFMVVNSRYGQNAKILGQIHQALGIDFAIP